jgi:hypothetical protein
MNFGEFLRRLSSKFNLDYLKFYVHSTNTLKVECEKSKVVVVGGKYVLFTFHF